MNSLILLALVILFIYLLKSGMLNRVLRQIAAPTPADQQPIVLATEYDMEIQENPSEKNFRALSIICKDVDKVASPFFIQSQDKLNKWAEDRGLFNPMILFSTEQYPKIGFLNQPYGVVAKFKNNPNTGIVIFRGTKTPSEIFIDVSSLQVDLQAIASEFPSGYGIHAGFGKQYGLYTTNQTSKGCQCASGCTIIGGQNVCETLNNCGFKIPVLNKYVDSCLSSGGLSLGGMLKAWAQANPDVTNYIVTGYSLGGAIASLAALHLSYLDKTVSSVYTFASPRVGSPEFAELYNSRIGAQTFRFAYVNDQVTQLPPAFVPKLGCFQHVGLNHYYVEYWPDRTDPKYKCGLTVYAQQHGGLVNRDLSDFNVKQIFG